MSPPSPNDTLLLLAQLEQQSRDLTYGMEAMWLILTGTGILFMQVGFMALEVGVVRAKVVKAAIYKNLFDHAVGTLAWYLIGFSLFMGNSPFAAGDDVVWFAHDAQHYAKIFQQYGFAVTACTIVSGAVISRCRLEVYLVFCFLLAGYMYPIIAHFCWNGSGWLAQLGFLDFAGGAVVHLLGGVAAFVGALACGPRVGRFAGLDERSEGAGAGNSAMGLGSLKELTEGGGGLGKGFAADPQQHPVPSRRCRQLLASSSCFRPTFRVRAAPGHSAALQGLGALFLYVAWFSFNGGSGGRIDSVLTAHLAGRAVINTMIASASASIAGLVWSKLFHDAYSMDMGVNSLLSGLVAITGPCGFIDPWASFVVGVLSVPVYVLGSNIVLFACKVDDPLNAVAVHAFNGVLGVVWIGFTDLDNGLFYTGDARLLGVQCLGCVVVVAWTAVNSLVYFYGIKLVWPYMPSFNCGCCCCGGGGKTKTSSPYDDLMRGDEVPNALVYPDDVQLVGMDFTHFGGSSFPDFDVEAVAEYNETKRIKERVVARRVNNNNRVSRQVPENNNNSESSLHWKDLSVHNKLKGVNSFNNLVFAGQQNSPKGSGNGGGFSAPPSPRNSEDDGSSTAHPLA